VECALKAAIARRTQRHEFPPKPTVVRGIYDHDLKYTTKSGGPGEGFGGDGRGQRGAQTKLGISEGLDG
ncbi:MAG TPA: hypothetical protein VGF01_19635, partial [Terracidiphilus sp.]